MNQHALKLNLIMVCYVLVMEVMVVTTGLLRTGK